MVEKEINLIISIDNTTMDFSKHSRKELLDKCREMKCSKYSSKNKSELCELLKQHNQSSQPSVRTEVTIRDFQDNGRTIDLNKGFEFIDLFCGIGGFHQAMNRTGNSKCVFACDIDKNCRDTYEENYKIKPVGDITKIDTIIQFYCFLY